MSQRDKFHHFVAICVAEAEDHFVVRIQKKTGHKVLPESDRAAIEWFVKWLKP